MPSSLTSFFAYFNCLILNFDHHYKEFILGRFNHASMLLGLCIRSMGKEDYFKRHIHHPHCNSCVDRLGHFA